VFPLIKEKLGSVKLFIVGGNPPPSVKELAGLSQDISVTGYVPDVSSFLQGCRIMIAPIRYGAGIKGKITESMSHGLPVVTTTIGAEGMDAVDGESIMTADSPEEMAEKCVRLYSDKELWDRISTNSRQLAIMRYSPEAVAEMLDRVVAGDRLKV
jgi:glycosyltransferase involved in cell wall biosynthesis